MTNKHPLERLDYNRAFDQTQIYLKYRKFLNKLGVLENIDFIFFSMSSELKRQVKTRKKLSQNSQCVTTVEIEDLSSRELESFQKACIDQLRTSRRDALLEPAYGPIMGLMAGAISGLAITQGNYSFWGKFGILAGFINSFWFLRDILISGYNYYKTPTSPIDAFEIDFALNKCYIPQSIWPKIIEKFMLFRQNLFEQQASLEFIEFSLGLKLHQPLQEFHINELDIQKSINKRIDVFFEKYENDEGFGLFNLKIAIFDFIHSLITNDRHASRHVFLVGRGGIGKTYFIQELRSWLRQEMNDMIHFESAIITQPKELEGDEVTPGIFLKVLRNQSFSKKRGSILMMNEGTFLNREDMVSPSKRIFNGNFAKLSASYFGNGISGDGVKINLPIQLVLVSSNDDIKDEALKSHFSVIRFPLPKNESIVDYGLSRVLKNYLIGNSSKNNIKDAISRKLKTCQSFRDADYIIDNMMGEILSQEYS
jgi:hypothetical protein